MTKPVENREKKATQKTCLLLHKSIICMADALQQNTFHKKIIITIIIMIMVVNPLMGKMEFWVAALYTHKGKRRVMKMMRAAHQTRVAASSPLQKKKNWKCCQKLTTQVESFWKTLGCWFQEKEEVFLSKGFFRENAGTRCLMDRPGCCIAYTA